MPKFFDSLSNFFTGSPAKRENVSTLRPEQEDLYRQLQNAAMNKGAGGAFGASADYYRNLMSENPEALQAFAAPEMRRFQQEIIPGLSEQFAGMGSGGLSSSGFRNAAVGAGADLSERLGAIRANLRQQGAQGLMNIGNQGLQSYSQNMETQPGSEGFLSSMAPAIGTGIGTAIGGPLGGIVGGAAGNLFSSSVGSSGNVGQKSSPYGNPPTPQQNFSLPSFQNR